MAIGKVGDAQAAATSVALPTPFDVGDLAVVFAYRNASTTPPTIPAGWTEVTKTTGADTNSRAIGYRVLEAGDTSTGTWTNATAITVIVLRGQKVSGPIGVKASGGTNTTTLTTPKLEGMAAGGSSWVVAFAGSKATNANARTLAETTDEGSSVTALNLATGRNISSWASRNYSATVGTAGNRTDAVEVLAEPEPTTEPSKAVRRFNGLRPDGIVTGLGMISTDGALTLLVLAKLISNNHGTFVSLDGNEGDAIYRQRVSLWLSESGQLMVSHNDETDLGLGIETNVADGWCLYGLTKPAGTSKYVAHRYVVGTKAWTHAALAEALSQIGTVNGGITNLGYDLQYEENGTNLDACVAAIAVWNKALSNAELEEVSGISSLKGWLGKSPSALWLFNQKARTEGLVDLTGNGANEEGIAGTSVVAEEPPIPYEAAPAAGLSMVV